MKVGFLRFRTFYAYKIHLSESRLFMLFTLIKCSRKKNKIVLITSFTILLTFTFSFPFLISIITIFFNNHNTLQLSQSACMTNGNIITELLELAEVFYWEYGCKIVLN